MKTCKKTLIITSMLTFMIIAGTSIIAQDQNIKDYHPVVKELEELYYDDNDFHKIIDNALSSAVPTPDGWSNAPYGDVAKLYIWPEKSIDDLLDLFQNWLSFVPNTENGMQYYKLIYGLCYNNPNAIMFVSTEPGLGWTKKFVLARGQYMDSEKSIFDHIDVMEQWYNALGEKEWNSFKPPYPVTEGYKGYKTFNEFFIRELKNDSVRPVSDPGDPSIMVSPADGMVNVINSNLNTNSKIHTKYDEYLNVDQLLAGSEYAKHFIGGTATATVLLPPDYHHYHSPVGGRIVESKYVDSNGGVYFGMDGQFFTFSNNGNIGGYKSKYGVFGIYHRGYYIIKTEDYGYIGMVAIGLDDISSVVFEKDFENVSPDNAVNVTKGQRIGHFAYGGSTVVLLFEPGVLQGTKLKQGTQAAVLKTK
jgi:phosphatidylserine decarboxylase